VDALYSFDGERFVPGELTRGPWRPDAQHGGPPAALLARCSERRAALDGGRLARIAVELVRPVPLRPLGASVEAERVSRRVSRITAQLSHGDGVVARSQAVVLHVEDTEPVGAGDPPDDLPGPEATTGAPGWAIPEGLAAYHRDAVEHRFVSGGFTTPGPAVDWVRLRVPLVDAEDTSGWCRALAAADFGSGISAVFDATSTFGLINADLTVALHRAPRGEWLRLDARTRLGPHGVGLGTTALADVDGPVGVATQSLLALAVPAQP
jgi:hypothetical protein